MTTVAVTGACGYLGSVLLELLGAHPAVDRVIGIDTAEPTTTTNTRNLEFYRMDVRSPDLPRVLHQTSVVVHLAFATEGDGAEVLDVNVGGTRLLLEAAVHAGVRKVVFASSTMAYGAHPDNDFPLTEASPLRGLKDVPHSGHKAEAEEIVRAFAATHPDLESVVLRLSPVLGPTLSGTATRVVESPYAFSVRGYDVPGQALHEADAGRALLVATLTDLQGVFNVCPDDWVPAEEIADILGQRRVEIDPNRAEQAAERVSRLKLGGVPTAFMPFLMYPAVASNGKLSATGFTFEYSARDALRAGAEARKGWVAVGDVHFRPKRLALVGGAAVAVLLGGAVRSRRKKL